MAAAKRSSTGARTGAGGDADAMTGDQAGKRDLYAAGDATDNNRANTRENKTAPTVADADVAAARAQQPRVG